MKYGKQTIYVLVYCPPVGCDPHLAWDVIEWSQHPALAPYTGGRRKVSTAAGDVELRIPPIAEGNDHVLGWAYQHIERIHPRPEILLLETMIDEVLLREALKMSLEYIALAEDGRGHNARSRYLARQLRELHQHIAQCQPEPSS